MMHINSELEVLTQLIHESILDNSDLKYIPLFEAYNEKFPTNEEVTINCQSQIGFIYFHHQLHSEALNHFLPLIDERGKIEDFLFSNILLQTLQCLSQENRLPEAKNLFERFIDDQCNDNFYHLEAMLVWFTLSLKPTEEELQLYKPKLKQLMDELGYFSEKPTIHEQVLDAKKVHLQANRRFSEIQIDYRKDLKSKTIQRLNDFIDSSPLGFYVKLAVDFKRQIEKLGQ
ncbi:hypothetical protein JYB64_12975 [Algoriphagus aestuarii]|nr:hypothetical protein [Algoriphagus aestuarii]